MLGEHVIFRHPFLYPPVLCWVFLTPWWFRPQGLSAFLWNVAKELECCKRGSLSTAACGSPSPWVPGSWVAFVPLALLHPPNPPGAHSPGYQRRPLGQQALGQVWSTPLRHWVFLKPQYSGIALTPTRGLGATHRLQRALRFAPATGPAPLRRTGPSLHRTRRTPLKRIQLCALLLKKELGKGRSRNPKKLGPRMF